MIEKSEVKTPMKSLAHESKIAVKSAILLLPGAVDFVAIEQLFPDWLGRSLVIAVDKGIDKAETLQQYRKDLAVDLWVGDFDSSIHLSVAPSLYGEKIPYPVDKDEIDTELALSIARDRGIHEVLILGGIGGRIDHQMALLFLPFQFPELQFYHSNGEQALYHLQCEKNYCIHLAEGSLVSIIALTSLSGLTLLNVKWPLHDFELAIGRGLTYSNRALGDTITAEIKKGSAWVFIANPGIDESL